MREKHSIGLILTLWLVLALFTPCIVVIADTSPLTENELSVTPMDRTGFIYNPYSVFVYYKGSSNDGIIRFTDTVHYFNTLNVSVSFTFNARAFHENRAHTIFLPENVDRENYIFYAIPKTTKWTVLSDTLTVESMYKGIIELKVEIDEDEAYSLAGDGGLIGLVSATPSVSQNIGGNIVTSVPSYKVFIVLLPEEGIQNSNGVRSGGKTNGFSPWILYTIVIAVILIVVAVVLAKKLEYGEVEENIVEK